MPDNTPASVCEGSTMDIAIIRSLFSNTIQAAEILQTDMNFRSELIQGVTSSPLLFSTNHSEQKVAAPLSIG